MTTHLALEWTDTYRDWIVDRPLQIAANIAVALVLRWVLHRIVDRLTHLPRKNGARPPLLRALRERAPRLRPEVLADRRNERARTIGSVVKSTISIILLMWVTLTSLDTLGFDIRPFIASAGVIGVAIGFGAQNLVRDFLSGIFMLLEDQYGVGDVVDLGEASGTVETVGLRVTTVRDIDGTLWYVRNGEVMRVGNMSQGHAVARTDIPIGHGNDVDQAGEIALAAATATVTDDDGTLSGDILSAPELVGVTTITPQAVTIRVSTRVYPGRQWAVQRRQQARILGALDQAGISPPYPGGPSAQARPR